MDTVEITAVVVAFVESRLKELGWNRAKLAKESGIAAPHITNLLRPGSTTSLETVGKLADALDVHPADLVGGISTMPFRGAVAAGPFGVCEDVERGQRFDVRGLFPQNCFLLRVSGKSCTGFGILDGEMVVVKPTQNFEEGRFVVARQGNGYTLKGYFEGQLYAWTPGQPEPLPVELDEETEIVGVVVQRLGNVEFRPHVHRVSRKGRK